MSTSPAGASRSSTCSVARRAGEVQRPAARRGRRRRRSAGCEGALAQQHEHGLACPGSRARRRACRRRRRGRPRRPALVPGDAGDVAGEAVAAAGGDGRREAERVDRVAGEDDRRAARLDQALQRRLRRRGPRSARPARARRRPPRRRRGRRRRRAPRRRRRPAPRRAARRPPRRARRPAPISSALPGRSPSRPISASDEDAAHARTPSLTISAIRAAISLGEPSSIEAPSPRSGTAEGDASASPPRPRPPRRRARDRPEPQHLERLAARPA